jgi:cell wall-associated NlpC family hydrolase
MSVRLASTLLLVALLAGCQSAPPPRTTGEDLASFALTLRGTQYRYGGATRGGFDCSGLVFYAHRQFGLDVPRTAREQSKRAERVKPRKLKPGDLVFFSIDSWRVNHVGIYIGDGRFVHAPGRGKPVTVDSLDDEFYDDAFESAGRFWKEASR